uniref:RAP domain-containing protein n=1 Tax=Zooxanthella nutricula TaxID=1333877 RepID=A0A7S2NGD6_9DINO
MEASLRDGRAQKELWGQYAKRAEELLITMPLEKTLRVLKALVLAKHRGADIYTHLGAELAKEVRNASSTRLCQVLHWLARAGLRDQTLMTLMGNETLLRLSDDFVVDMHIEVLNVHAKLEVRNPRLVSAVLRDLTPLCAELSRDQVCAVAPVTVMNVLSDQARIAYLSRCAELGMGLPARMTRPAVLRQFRLLEDCLRLDYHPTSLPNVVQLWLANLKAEADAQDVIEPVPLTQTEEDIFRVLREELDVAVAPVLQDGILTLHLVMGKAVLEVLDSHADYYVTPAMGGQRLLRAETKLRQRLLWRRGWRVLSVDSDEWTKLTDDMYKKDLLEAVLHGGGGSRRAPQHPGAGYDQPH